jgi:hypothetical protein
MHFVQYIQILEICNLNFEYHDVKNKKSYVMMFS